MQDAQIQVQLVKSDPALMPEYMSEGASGMDLKAAIDNDVVLNPGERQLIPTGIAISMPRGIEAQVRPRSGLAVKHGVTMVNNPGTIDSDYRGEIKVILINHGQEAFTVTPRMRIAQMVFAEVLRAKAEIVELLSETTRATGGFGHTGLK